MLSPETLITIGSALGMLALGFVGGVAWGRKHPDSAAVISQQAAEDLAKGEAVVTAAVSRVKGDIDIKL